MPQKIELDIKWRERYAYWPTRSSWSNKRIWLEKYWEGDIYHDTMGRPPIKANSWKLIYTQNEYLLMLLREDEAKWQHPLSNKIPENKSPFSAY
jgi:hypothetical protein